MMGMQDHQPGRDVLIDKMAQTVTVEGTLVKRRCGSGLRLHRQIARERCGRWPLAAPVADARRS